MSFHSVFQNVDKNNYNLKIAMKMNNESEDLDPMLDEIRKELVSIIEDHPNAEGFEIINATNDNKQTPKHDKSERRRQRYNPSRGDASNNGLLHDNRFNNIDDDLNNMCVNLMRSYELFQNVGGRFESFNFNGLLDRIKDLNLSGNTNEAFKATVDDLKRTFDEDYKANRLNEMTKTASSKFNKHAGEFADIPEVGEFFRACSHLERGLEQLKKQRTEVNELTKRMTWAINTSYNRIDEIQKGLKEKNQSLQAAEGDDKKRNLK
ncbi:uncharacterized protein LOC119638439 isoform X1 [Glossina fuscipes]|uniref:Uncharacterized protein LOC119638439 isoform X1 n=2 Tax=Glossina fuscipes TaxID=7396 RepID=A0A9C6DT90_9MUSC|nr:uncharacterized protein LOC119638439 isoform X1 [Glossina fuscipes]